MEICLKRWCNGQWSGNGLAGGGRCWCSRKKVWISSDTHTKGANPFDTSILRDSGERDIFLLMEKKMRTRTAFEIQS